MGQFRQVLERVQDATLKLKLSKCSFTQSKVKIFGHLINETGIKIDFDNIKEVLEELLRRRM